MPRCRYPRPQRSCMAPRSAYSAPLPPLPGFYITCQQPHDRLESATTLLDSFVVCDIASTKVMDHALVMLPQQSTSWPSTGTKEVLSSASRENTHSNEEERMLEKELKTRYRTTITSKGGISQRFTQQAVFRDGLLFRARRRGHFSTTRYAVCIIHCIVCPYTASFAQRRNTTKDHLTGNHGLHDQVPKY